MNEDLAGRSVLVTGASSGIGLAVADAVVAAGGRVALVARSADRLAEHAERLGAAAVAMPADVTDPDDLERAVATVAERFGGLDAVVCSAGVVVPGPVSDTTPDDWRAMFEVNVLGTLNTVHAALPHLRAAPLGDIVTISSMSGRRRSSVEMGIYSASKFAVHVLADSLREELSPDDIRVTVISPGYVRTPIFDSVGDEDRRADYEARLREVGLEPSAVAAQVVHALRQPAGVDLVEIAVMSTDQ